MAGSEKKSFFNLGDIKDFIELYQSSAEWGALQGKSQVFDTRVDPVVKSRGSHSTDVGDIAKSLVARMMASKQAEGVEDGIDYDVEMERAKLIGVLHDIGHIAYGHPGESTADDLVRAELMSSYAAYKLKTETDPTKIKEYQDIIAKNGPPTIPYEKYHEIRVKFFGAEYANKNQAPCFEHNENSAMLYAMFCYRYGYEVDESIIKGILAHSTSRVKELPEDLAQQAVRLADKLAYINYDIQDLLTTFKEGTPERDALNKMYDQPLKDPDGNEFKMSVTINGQQRELSIQDFLGLEVSDRIRILEEASIADAMQNGYKLTGCNDLAVQIAGIQKGIGNAKTEEEKENLRAQLLEKQRELYRRSPIMFAAYQIKDRTDNFIRAGVNLPDKVKEERHRAGAGFVGNQEIKNAFVYRVLTEFIKEGTRENKKGKNRDNIKERLSTYLGDSVSKKELDGYVNELMGLLDEYEKYKEKMAGVVTTRCGKGAEMPEIMNIVGFIGSHSNDQLTDIAKRMGVDLVFEKVVLKEIEDIMANPDYYDKENKKFTKAGKEERDKIVEEYGVFLKCEFSLEEEGISPIADEETIDRLLENGCEVPGHSEQHREEQDKRITFTERFKRQQAKIKELIINAIKNHSQEEENSRDPGQQVASPRSA